METPIYYQISFSLFAFNNQDDLKQHRYKRDFIDPNPLIAREKAFEAFEEYISWLSSLGGIEEAEDNYKIIQPEYISKPIEEKWKKFKESEENNDDSISYGISHYSEWSKLYEKYQEELRIDLIHPEEQEMENNQEDYPLTIHKVASYDYDPDDLLCGGLYVEVELYHRYGFDTGDLLIEVEYYGTDYSEAGDDPDAGQYKILRTPRKWISEKDEVEENESLISHDEIIRRGEGKYIEFKSALLFNFKTRKPGISIKYIVAKAIASFLNTDGGILYIGVDNDGDIQGLEYDYSVLEGNKKDRLKLEFDQLIRHFFPAFVSNYIQTQIIAIQEKEIYVIRVYASKKPVFLISKKHEIPQKEFYRRVEASSLPIDDVEEIIDFIFNNKNFEPNFDRG